MRSLRNKGKLNAVDKCSHKRERQKARREDSEDRQRPERCTYRERGWTSAHGTRSPWGAWTGPALRASRKDRLQTSRFQTFGLQNWDKLNSCFSVSHQVCSNLLQQPQQTSTISKIHPQGWVIIIYIYEVELLNCIWTRNNLKFNSRD